MSRQTEGFFGFFDHTPPFLFSFEYPKPAPEAVHAVAFSPRRSRPGPSFADLLSLSLVLSQFTPPEPHHKELERWGCQRGRKRQGAAARRIFLRRGRWRQEEGGRAWYSMGGVQQPAGVAAHPRQVAHLDGRFRVGRLAGAEVPREEGVWGRQFDVILGHVEINQMLRQHLPCSIRKMLPQ